MWIDPFIAGIVMTIIAEFVLLIIYVVIKGSKKK